VATKLIKKDKSQVRGGVISVELAVETCFRDLGCNDYTNGSFRHEFESAIIVPNLPKFMLGGIFKEMKDIHQNPEKK